MAAYSAQRASHERKSNRFSAHSRQRGVHHTHGHAEYRDFGTAIPQAMQMYASHGRKHAGNHAEHQTMGMTQSRLTKEGSQETAGDEE
jgi:hypothetical protein